MKSAKIVTDDNSSVSQVLAGGVPSPLQHLPGAYITHGRDGQCWDQHGSRYIDFVCGYGSIILGHANQEVNNAVIEQMQRGINFPSFSPLHEELASLLKQIFPYADRVLFHKTGSEAVSAAIRLARTFTSRNVIIRCGFHGWHDSIISPHLSWHQYEPDPLSPRIVPGVLASRDPQVLLWTGESLEELSEILDTNHTSVAALILDPVQLREPLGKRLRDIRDLVYTFGAILILDEAKTGFRVHLSGVQGLYDIQPDITILSKAIANGFPLSAVLGRDEILANASITKIMGTYNNELLSIVASLCTIAILQQSAVAQRLQNLGTKLIDGINQILIEYNLIEHIQAVAYLWPCMPYLWFKSHSEIARRLKPRFYLEMAQRGVLLLPGHMNFICMTHTMDDITYTIDAVRASISLSLSTEE